MDVTDSPVTQIYEEPSVATLAKIYEEDVVTTLTEFVRAHHVDTALMKEKVRTVLGLSPKLDVHWSIIDTFPAENPVLALAHYNDDFVPDHLDLDPLRRVRGVIVDTDAGRVVCESNGYVEDIQCAVNIYTQQDKESNKERLMIFGTKNVYLPNDPIPKEKADYLDLDPDNTKLYLGYEGVMVRIFKWRGQAFFSVHRKIDGNRSHWGGRKTFRELYNELKGPVPESLFGPEENSPYCYLFIVAHNDVRLASSTTDAHDFRVGIRKLWDGEGEIATDFAGALHQKPITAKMANKFMFPFNNAEYDAKLTSHEIRVEYDGDDVKEIYFNSDNLPINPDSRLRGGDFVIISTLDASGRTVVYRLLSDAFAFRNEMTNGSANMYRQFVVQLTNFSKAHPKSLLSQYPHYLDQGRPIKLDTVKDRHQYWANVFYDSVDPSHQEEVGGFLGRYHTGMTNLAAFIMNINNVLDNPEQAKLLKQNVEDDRIEMIKAIREMAIVTKDRRPPTKRVQDQLTKLSGKDIYRLLMVVERIPKFKSRPVKTQ